MVQKILTVQHMAPTLSFCFANERNL